MSNARFQHGAVKVDQRCQPGPGREPVGLFIHGHGHGHVLLQAALPGGGRGQWRVGHAGDGGGAQRDLRIAFHDGFAQLLPARLHLPQDEEVFATVVAVEGGFDFVQRRAAAAVAQSQ